MSDRHRAYWTEHCELDTKPWYKSHYVIFSKDLFFYRNTFHIFHHRWKQFIVNLYWRYSLLCRLLEVQQRNTLTLFHVKVIRSTDSDPCYLLSLFRWTTIDVFDQQFNVVSLRGRLWSRTQSVDTSADWKSDLTLAELSCCSWGGTRWCGSRLWPIREDSSRSSINCTIQLHRWLWPSARCL